MMPAASRKEKTLRFLTVVGARPQFVKAAALSAELRKRHTEHLIHTGQHYDDNMSAVFFRELGIPEPHKHLNVGSGPHGHQTGLMLARVEQCILELQPDVVIVYGDTNSTLAGSLAAVKLHVPVAHVEAGLRSYNRRMPEEINRILTDRVATWCFAPSQTAVQNLAKEGITRGVHEVGDIMADCVRHLAPRAKEHSTILDRLNVHPEEYAIATVHRAENTDDPARLAAILEGLRRCPWPVVFPVHPRTRAAMRRYRWNLEQDGGPRGQLGPGQLLCIEPLGYLDMLQLQQHAAIVLTDSGGMQKEAYWLGVPCATLRDETEWVETVETGWNRLVGADPAKIAEAAGSLRRDGSAWPRLYGDGCAAARIAATDWQAEV
jgi:UDP-GlcNAc3NAcA epimerase